jgi:hypothetical protein
MGGGSGPSSAALPTRWTSVPTSQAFSSQSSPPVSSRCVVPLWTRWVNTPVHGTPGEAGRQGGQRTRSHERHAVDRALMRLELQARLCS